MKIGYKFIFDVILTYALLGLCYILAVKSSGFTQLVGLSLLHALLLHRLGLFIHAAAHRDFCKKDEKMNDLIYLAMLGWFFGIEIEGYRKKHWAHHKNHGTNNEDPEDTYSKGVNWRYFFEKIAPKVIAHKPSYSVISDKTSYFRIFAYLFHLIAFLLFAWITQSTLKAIIYYLIPIFFLLPFITHLRNCLEHTPVDNELSVTRSFGASPLSFFLGAAGFELHAEHHEAPYVEYWLLDSKFQKYKYSEVLFNILKIKNI